MEDVGRAPADVSAILALEPTTIPTLDGWIESLMNCKQLAESDVQRLCEKVSLASCLAAPSPRGHWFRVACFHVDRTQRRLALCWFILAMDVRCLASRTLLTPASKAREVLQEESNVQPVVSLNDA